MFLADLPKEHPDRNRSVGGMFHRWHCWKGGDITVAKDQRGEDWQWWGASAWKRIPKVEEARNPMAIASMTYNEIEEHAPFWTRQCDWAAEKLPARKKGELSR